jgi:hypothetical protein
MTLSTPTSNHTKEIGRGGSGAFVELIGGGRDSSGQRWCDTPTHMLSYSWSYSVVMIVDALRKFEHEHPSSNAAITSWTSSRKTARSSRSWT